MRVEAHITLRCSRCKKELEASSLAAGFGDTDIDVAPCNCWPTYALHPNGLLINFVINGENVYCDADPTMTLGRVATLACIQQRQESGPVFDVRDVKGVLLESCRILGEYKFEHGVRLFVSPRMPFGG